MKTKTDLFLLAVLVLLSIISTACTPDEIAQIQAAMDTAVIFTDGNVYYGYAQVFGHILAISINSDGTGMSINSVTGEFALARVKLLADAGWSRIAWSALPQVVRDAFWARIITVPAPMLFVLPEAIFEDLINENITVIS